jgi:hypothetical protein
MILSNHVEVKGLQCANHKKHKEVELVGWT